MKQHINKKQMKGGLSLNDVIEEIDPRTVHYRTFIKPEINHCLLRALPCDVPLDALHELGLAFQDWPILSHNDRFEIKTLLF